jgi:hypothetical protein
MKRTVLFLVVFLCIGELSAQEDIFGIDTKARPKNRKAQSDVGNFTRNLISNISFEFAGGGAYHQSSIQLMSEIPNQSLLWRNQLWEVVNENANINTLSPRQYSISQFRNFDSLQNLTTKDTLQFRGGDFAFPINLGIRINVFNTLTIGGGYGREFGRVSSLRGGDFEWTFEERSYIFDRVYGNIGLVLYDSRKRAKFLTWRYRKYASSNYYMQSEKNQRIRQNYPWRFLLDVEFGNIIVRQSFDESLNTNNSPFYSLGLRIEREFSEYTRFFVKAGAEFREFGLQAQNFNEFQNFRQTLYVAQVGFSINLPGTKRCKVPGCGVVMKHLHEGVEYRGSSIFNFQNRKIGQWY